MPNLGVSGVILLVIVALLLFGPSKLPELGRAFGRTLREFKIGAKEMMDDTEEKPSDKETNRIEVAKEEDKNRRLPD